jgi:UDP-N-acetylmuramoyl-tripeptide--D-alanyl-D-alanine ligase
MTETLWTGQEVKNALGVECDGALPSALTGVSFDTRTLAPGELFIAIKGDNSDGHAYLDKAFAAGAALAVISQGHDGPLAGPALRVADTFEALNALGRAGRDRAKGRIAAVTGSVGKTGTKEMLRLMLGGQGRVHASDKSYNNHWGVPLTAARLPADADYGIFEIGMNHAGEITPLTKLVRPHVALITTVAPVHIEHFGTTTAIAEAKAEIFLGLEPGGTVIVNRDNEHFRLLAGRASERRAGQIVRFGRALGAEACLLSLEPLDGGSRIEADILGTRITYQLGAPGEHLAMNSIAALAAVHCLGGDVIAAAAALANFMAPQGRGAQSVRACPGGNFLLIDESYNANPASMLAALTVIASLPDARATRRIAVLGDMLELGPNGADMHRALAEPIEAKGIDAVFCAGPQSAALFEALQPARRGAWAETSAGIKDALLDFVKPGDAITIKGSFGSRMGLLVEALKEKFPEMSGAERTATE